MTVTHYDLVETFEVTHVVLGRDTTRELETVARDYSGEGCTWDIQGSAVVFKRPMGSTLTSRED